MSFVFRRFLEKPLILQKLRFYSTNMSKKALVFLAPGCEEMEFIISVDVLRRGGVNVTVAGLPDSNKIKGAHDIYMEPDISITEAKCKGPFDLLVLPGGLGGSKTLSESKEVGELLKDQEASGRLIGAICAAPTALKTHGIGLGKNLTSYPAKEQELKDTYCYKQDKVVVDGTLITSRGPGTAFDFALTLVDKLMGKDKACEVAKAMLLTY